MYFLNYKIYNKYDVVGGIGFLNVKNFGYKNNDVL